MNTFTTDLSALLALDIKLSNNVLVPGTKYQGAISLVTLEFDDKKVPVAIRIHFNCDGTTLNLRVQLNAIKGSDDSVYYPGMYYTISPMLAHAKLALPKDTHIAVCVQKLQLYPGKFNLVINAKGYAELDKGQAATTEVEQEDLEVEDL